MNDRALPADIKLLNQIINEINTYTSSRKELGPKETFLMGLINPIYAYAGEKEPLHRQLSPKAKMFSYIGMLQAQKLTKLPANINLPNIVSSFPLLETTQQSSHLFKELIQELKNKISPYSNVNEASQNSNAFMQFGRKVVEMVKDTVSHPDDHFQKLIQELNKILADTNIRAIENQLSSDAKAIVVKSKPQDQITSTGAFEKVPKEIMYEIFKYLDVKSTIKINQVCRFFNALNSKALWQSYLDHDFPDAVTNQWNNYNHCPQELYIALYLKKKHTPVIYVPVIVSPDSLSIVNNDPVRLLNRIFSTKQLTRIDSAMAKSSIPEAVGSIGNLISVNYLTKEEGQIRQSTYAILGFDSEVKITNQPIQFDENLAKHLVEIAWTDYHFPKDVNHFANELAWLLKNNYTLNCDHIPVRFNGKLFEKVSMPAISIENKAETNEHPTPK